MTLDYIMVGTSKDGTNFRVVSNGELAFVQRNKPNAKDNWLAIGAITTQQQDKAIKKAQYYVKKGYTANRIPCQYDN